MMENLSLNEDLIFTTRYYKNINRISILKYFHLYHRNIKNSLAHKYLGNVLDYISNFFEIFSKEIKPLLLENDAYNDKNKHAIKNYFMWSSFKEGVGEICQYITFNKNLPLPIKILNVNKYMNKNIMIESIKYCKPNSLWEKILYVVG